MKPARRKMIEDIRLLALSLGLVKGGQQPSLLAIARKLLDNSGAAGPHDLSRRAARRVIESHLRSPGAPVVAPSPPKEHKAKPKRAPRQRAVAPHAAAFIVSDDFLRSYQWRELRMRVLRHYGAICMCCGARPPDVVINVDHVLSRRQRPDLALTFSNMQVLCNPCNHGKGNKAHDFRAPELPEPGPGPDGVRFWH